MALIGDALAWLATPAPWRARRLGYVGESLQTLARWRRNKRAWETHLAASRSAVARGVRDLAGGTCLVLGSGGVLDVPLADLARRFDTVWLLDLVHPWRARWRALGPGVRLATVDLAGLAGRTPRGLAAGWHDPAPSAVISANVLSQLPIRPCRGVPAAEADALGGAIVDAHLADLARLRRAGTRVILLTDVAWESGPAGGGADSAGDPIHGRHLPPGPEWSWDQAPAGELPEGRWRRHRVRALVDPAAGALRAAAPRHGI